jgi:adenylyltransferase/sulfurtransferase
MRYSCPLLARQNILLGKVPTTPTIASIIGAMQSQEALKVINDMPIQPGKVTHFNGMVNDMHTTAYVPRDDCQSHWTYGEITELPARAEHTTLGDLLRIARADLGPDAMIELDQELITSLACPNCNTTEQILKPLNDVTFEAGHCPTCGILRETTLTHIISGEENFLHRTLASVGVPSLHILRVHNGVEYRFYELTGDLPDALHFRDFERTKISITERKSTGRVRIKDAVKLEEVPLRPISGRVKLSN